MIEIENQKSLWLNVWLLPLLMNGQVSIKDAKEYVQVGEVSMAAEEGGSMGIFKSPRSCQLL